MPTQFGPWLTADVIHCGQTRWNGKRLHLVVPVFAMISTSSSVLFGMMGDHQDKAPHEQDQDANER
jgi:hypothetical protein